MTDITIIKGSTFSRVLRWEAPPFVYSAITGITRAAPCVITSASHGLVTGWRAAVLSAGGMRQINAKGMPPRASDFHKVTATSSSLVTLNTVNSADWTAYTSGGFLCSYTPVSISGYTARMMIRLTDQATGDPLVSLTQASGITLDDTNHTITVTISATATAALDFASGVYDIEMVSGAGVVTKLLSGAVTVSDEVTRS